MKMRKKLLSIGLLGILVFGEVVGLSACHGTTEKISFEIPEEFDATRKYEISFWAKNDTNKAQTDIYKKAIADFQEIYPNITVNLKLYTDYGRIYNDVITNIATNTVPNICITYPDHIATYMTSDGLVVPLDELLVHEQYGLGGSQVLFDAPTKEELVEQHLEECKFNGYYYALPYMRSTEACYVNKTYVEQLGYTLPEVLTWDFIWEVSEAAMKKDADGNYLINGQKVMIPFIYKSTDNMMIQLLKQSNSGYSTPNGEIQIFNDTTKDLLYAIGEHGKTGAFSTFKISSYPANFLNAGQCIFAVDSTAGATWMGTDAPLIDISEEAIVDFETEVMLIPQVDTANPQMISQGPSMCIFNKGDSQEVMATWLFMQYLLTNEIQIAYAQTEGYAPVTTKARESEEYLDYLSRSGEDNDTYYDVKIKATKLLLDNVENTFVTPVFNGSASLRDAAGQLIEETVKAVRRKKTVDEAFLDELFDDITALYRLDQLEGQQAALGSKAQLGPLPKTAVCLLSGIGIAWVGILSYMAVAKRKDKRKNQ